MDMNASHCCCHQQSIWIQIKTGILSWISSSHSCIYSCSILLHLIATRNDKWMRKGEGRGIDNIVLIPLFLQQVKSRRISCFGVFARAFVDPLSLKCSVCQAKAWLGGWLSVHGWVDALKQSRMFGINSKCQTIVLIVLAICVCMSIWLPQAIIVWSFVNTVGQCWKTNVSEVTLSQIIFKNIFVVWRLIKGRV